MTGISNSKTELCEMPFKNILKCFMVTCLSIHFGHRLIFFVCLWKYKNTFSHLTSDAEFPAQEATQKITDCRKISFFGKDVRTVWPGGFIQHFLYFFTFSSLCYIQHSWRFLLKVYTPLCFRSVIKDCQRPAKKT